LRIKDDALLFKFLYQFLNSDYFEQKCIESSRGIAQLNMSTEWLKDYPLPIPSLDEQQAIVRELDGINRLIDLQEEQLREYDRLAQSLFYTTFGDPVSNPKGWEVKKLGEVAPCVQYSGDIQERKGKYWLLNLDMVESQTGNVIDYLWVDKSEVGGSTTMFNEDYVLYSKLRPYLNKVVLPSHSGYCTTELLPLLPCKDLHKIYLALVLRSKAFVDYIQAKVAGAKMPRVTMNDFKGFNIPLPPLALQQTFAAQIEAIEQQKALIRRSLDETRTLLAARMQYYFE
jgi:type I restriction enzyme S subunit